MQSNDSLKEIQQKVNGWIINHGGYWPPLAMLAAIIEELGELAKEINSNEGFKPKKMKEKGSRLGEELGDLLFSLICLANYYKIDLNTAFNKVIKKYIKRDSTRFL